MGTNYYLYKKDAACTCCGREFDGAKLHIGKSSMGWCFSLNTHPEHGIHSLDDWRREWSKDGVVILNEYRDVISVDEMEKTITARFLDKSWDKRAWGIASYRSEADFHFHNHSLRGPNGLLRHVADGRLCIGHGEGTWDIMRGEFS